MNRQSLAGLFAVGGAIAWRNVHNMVSNPALLIPSVAAPLAFFTVFAGGLSGLGDAPGFEFSSGYQTFQFVYIMMQAAAFAGIFAGIGMGRDFESGFMRRLFLAAPRRGGIILGYALGVLGRVTIVFSALFAVGLLAGVRLDGNPWEILMLIALIGGFSLVTGFWSIGIALRIRSQQAVPLMRMPTFIILFLAPIFVPLDLLSGWIHTAAVVNPVTIFLEAGRGLISGDQHYTGLAFGAALAMAAAGSVWALTGLRRAEAAGG